MEYITISGKVGMYGEIPTEEWQDMRRRPIAIIQHNNDGTLSVTLYTDKQIGHTRTMRDVRVARNVCKAHLLERGFTKLYGEYADVKAYND